MEWIPYIYPHTLGMNITYKYIQGVPRRSAGKPPTHVYSEESVPKRWGHLRSVDN